MTKTLIALMAVAALQLTASAVYADDDASALMSADDIATQDGLEDLDLEANAADDLRPPPPRPRPPMPRPPRPPHPVPPPHHPHPVPPPHHPHPVPPPYNPHPVPPPYNPPPSAWYECFSQDLYGYRYVGRDRSPRYAQREAHDRCVYQSNGPCRDLGCRRY